VVALALAACDSSRTGGEGEGEGEGEAPTIPVPALDGEHQVVFMPTVAGIYVNDHTIFGDISGLSLVGITGVSGNPHEERSFVAATAPAMLGPWTEAEQPALRTTDPGATERVLWAPHVFLRPDTPDWQMAYYGGDEQVLLATSEDGIAWTRQGLLLEAGRDPMVFQHDERYLLYAVEVVLVGGEEWPIIAVYSSADGRDWAEAGVALMGDEPRGDNRLWLESPFLVERAGRFYLFVTHVSAGGVGYFRTDVHISDDPLSFDHPPVTSLDAHAAEVVEAEGRMWLTSGGWPKYVGEDLGLKIAPLIWR
jgi:arabinan endo-1,5-alpha-L-arabinosidase